jgi:hypothetical protein
MNLDKKSKIILSSVSAVALIVLLFVTLHSHRPVGSLPMKAIASHETVGGGGGAELPTPGSDGNLLTSDGSAWTSAAPASQLPSPGSSGNILTSNGSAWTSAVAPSGASAPLILQPTLGTDIPLLIKGAAGQLANYFNITNSDDVPVVSVDRFRNFIAHGTLFGYEGIRTFGGYTGAKITLANSTITDVVATLTGASGQTAHLLDINTFGNTDGDIACIDAAGNGSNGRNWQVGRGITCGNRVISFGPSSIGTNTITVTGTSGATSNGGLGNAAITGSQLTFPAVTDGTNGGIAYIAHNGSGAGNVTAFGLLPMFSTTVYVTDTANVRIWALLTNVVGGSFWNTDTPGATDAESGIGFRYSTGAGDTTWKFASFNGVGDTFSNSGIAVTTLHLYHLECYAVSASSVFYRVSDLTAGTSATGTISTTLPGSSTQIKPIDIVTGLTASVKTENFGTTWLSD